jgi:hypothetical protein
MAVFYFLIAPSDATRRLFHSALMHVYSEEEHIFDLCLVSLAFPDIVETRVTFFSEHG